MGKKDQRYPNLQKALREEGWVSLYSVATDHFGGALSLARNSAPTQVVAESLHAVLGMLDSWAVLLSKR